MEQEQEVQLQGVEHGNKRARSGLAGSLLWVPKKSLPNLV